MRKSFFYVAVMVMMVLTAACSKNDDLTPTGGQEQSGSVVGEKTVLVYMAGRNNLSDTLKMDLEEIKYGSRAIDDRYNLLVFVRDYDGAEKPWVARIRNGRVTDSLSISDLGIQSSDGQNRASDPVVMEGVMKYAFSHYPASKGEYGLVLWGHGSGWLMKKEVKKPTRAYGVDYGNYRYSKDGRWINTPVLADILKRMPHLKYIMGDCCNLMCLENLYELRDVCDYIIGSPAEIPEQGAPYHQIVPDMFADGQFYKGIVDKYYESIGGCLPLTVIRTSEMESLAQATRQAMQSVKENLGNSYADLTGLIHYYYTNYNYTFQPEYNIFYDAGDFFRAYASQDAYQQWAQTLDQAVVECRKATFWNTDKLWRYFYSDFTPTEEKMHGVSMFIPQSPTRGDYAQYNEDIKQTEWYKASGMEEIGW
ncbi:MAG: hypothetical protein J5671_00675 [Bacteroidaceae bacterium]|nr:hypothetical protein [Bacteroidaceae bacterium]